MRTTFQQLGQAAEDLASEYLEKKKFIIMARNYRYGRAEIDIVAQKDELTVFVEVKARGSDQFGFPESFVNAQKQALVHAAAEDYILKTGWDKDIRFDVIAILRSRNRVQLNHFEDAF